MCAFQGSSQEGLRRHEARERLELPPASAGLRNRGSAPSCRKPPRECRRGNNSRRNWLFLWGR